MIRSKSNIVKPRHVGQYVLALALCFSTFNASALTVVERSFEELVARADTILIGTVSERSPQWQNPTLQNYIVTDTLLTDVEILKGAPSETYTLRTKGGKLGPYREYYEGLPQLLIDERYVLFIKNNYQAIFPIVGIDQGVLRIITNANNEETVTSTQGEALSLQPSPQNQVSKSLQPNSSIAHPTLSVAELKNAIHNELH